MHNHRGNCWEVAYKCKDGCGENLCDVCHMHDQPRASCSDCPRCVPCDDKMDNGM